LIQSGKVVNATQNTLLIRNEAIRLGFDYCGISKAERLNEDAKRLERWLNKGMHGKMQYMERWFDMRVDPRVLVPGAKSVISLMYNYFPTQAQADGLPLISKYAYGTDYHLVIKEKLKTLLNFIEERVGKVHGRAFVDSGPVLERTWAAKSGLGWVGKNGNLINKQRGSFFFLAELIVDLELENDSPVKDYCGSCTKCIDACPTDAISEGNVVDGGKCISYFTIELREAIPEQMKGKFSNRAFGCDICQDVCPWNRFAKPHREAQFEPTGEKLNLTTSDWLEMTNEVFNKVFKDSAIKRTRLEGMKRNVRFLLRDNNKSEI
jgi:epoxyqueuosine reductase